MCSQLSVEEKELERQLSEIVGTFAIPKEFYEWAMTVLREQNQVEFVDRAKITETHRKAHNDVIKKI